MQRSAERLKGHEWNMMTQMSEYGENPIIIESGEGVWLTDVNGHRYMDTNASMWTSTHGHNNPELNGVLKEQLNKFAHTTYVSRNHVAGIELAEQLATYAPSPLNRVMLLNNASAAIEAALKMSIQFWGIMGEGRKSILTLKGGYHGLSIGAMGVADSPQMHRGYECLNGHRAKVFDTLEGLEALLSQFNPAAVIMEPEVQSVRNGGIYLHEQGFLTGIAERCRENGAHLILDEALVGIGRLGHLFACEREGVTPDFLCLGKGLGAGYLPIAATLTTEAIYQAFLGDHTKTLIHGSTYGGNPLACRVAKKNLEMLKERIDAGDLREHIDYFENAVDQHFSNNKYVRSLRQDGMICGIELAREGSAKQVAKLGLKYDLIMRSYMNTLYIVPPLSITKDEIDLLCIGITNSINDYENSV